MPEVKPYITWGQLKDHLKDVPDDAPLVLSKDAEGNHFSPLADITLGVYLPDQTWFGDFSTEPDENEDEETRECYKDMKDDPDSVAAYCIWPLN